MAVQQSGGQADQEADSLLKFRPSGDLKIVFEGHLPGQEIEQCGADAERGDGHRRDSVLIAVGENGFARLEGKKVQAVDVKIDIAEKLVEIAGVDAERENGNVHFRIDVECHSGQNLNLGLAQAAHRGADLPIEIGDLKAVEVSDVELADAESGEGEQVEAANAAHAGDGDPFVAQDRLLGLSDPADIPGKRVAVIECLHDELARLSFTYDNHLATHLAY